MSKSLSRFAALIVAVAGVGGLMLTESCSNKSGHEVEVTNLDFDTETLPVLVAEDIWYPVDSIYAETYRVFGDSLLVLKNKTHNGPFIEVYSLNDSVQLNTFLNHGVGPGEVNFIDVEPHGNTLQVVDPNRDLYADIDISTLATLDSVPFKSYPSELIIVPSVKSINGKLFTQNLFHFVSKNKNINQPLPRFIYLSDGRKQAEETYEYRTLNIGQGNIAVKPDQEKVWYVARDSSRIEIYNPDFQLERVITGPIDLGEPKYGVYTNDYTNQKEVAYAGEFYEAYYDVVYDDNRVALLYYGQTWNPIKGAIETMPSYIFVMDWDGNLKGAYKAPAHLFNISLSGNPDEFYATIADEDDNPKPVRLKIPSK